MRDHPARVTVKVLADTGDRKWDACACANDEPPDTLEARVRSRVRLVRWAWGAAAGRM